MRKEVLRLLRNQTDGYLSGEEISRRLDVSRTAIWKHMQALKEEGYKIESHARKGYRLCSVPDLLLAEEICNGLKTKLIGQKGIVHLEEVDSTNNIAKQLAAKGCEEGLLVVAEEQTIGRGRLARGWFSPYGKGIWFSVVLRPPFAPQEAPKCTLLAAVAVARALREITGVECGIKWPNDILWQGRKLVGILTEMSAEMDAINHVVIGMGINVSIKAEEFPSELQEIAVSLAGASGCEFSRVVILQAILVHLESLYQKVLEQGFAPVLEAWRSLSATLGEKVRVIGLKDEFEGVAKDIDDDGALLVETGDGLKRVLAGDVSIRARS